MGSYFSGTNLIIGASNKDSGVQDCLQSEMKQDKIIGNGIFMDEQSKWKPNYEWHVYEISTEESYITYQQLLHYIL